MADRTIKPDDTNDLVLQNNDGSAKIEVNEAQTVVLTGGSTTALTIDTDGDIQIANTIDAGAIGSAVTMSANQACVKTALNASGSPPIYACRAWVNFDGADSTAGYVAIRASGNVSSVADDDRGQYTVNFTTAMTADTFAAVGSARDPRLAVASSGNITTSNVQVTCDLGGSDTSHAFVAIFQ